MSAPKWSTLTAKRLAGRITGTRVSSARGAAPTGHCSAVGRRGGRRNDGMILSPRCRVLAARKGYALHKPANLTQAVHAPRGC
jgi:hypothetical protein